MDLNAANMFVSVVHAGSLSAAAEKINVPLPTLRRRIRELERSSRGLKLTEPGSRLKNTPAKQRKPSLIG